MQFRDLKIQYRALKAEIDAGISDVLEQSSFIGGRKVELLEERLAEYAGVRHCISCANGTDALTLALMALDFQAGECAFVPDFTFFSTGEVVAYAGGEPVFVDVDEKTFNINPAALEKAILKVKEEGRLIPKVIIAVDLFGLPADYEAICKIAKKYDLCLIEDGAQGFGGEINGKRACSFGDISTTSFFPAKPLGCYGDGGALFTDRDDLAEYLHSVRVHGKGTNKYDNVRIGMNSRLDAIQAAVLLPKLKAFEDYEREAVNRAAGWYDARLKDYVTIPEIPAGFVSSRAQYTIRLKNETERDRLQNCLKEADIPSMIYYPKPMHSQAAFRTYSVGKGSFPVSERLCQTVLSLPMHPYLTEDDAEVVADAVIKFLK